MTDRMPDISQVAVEEEVRKSFLEYAMSVIVSRALPDVRDGLKPVHRRILYAMNEAAMRPGTPFKKCARVVGDVMAKYHPHSNDAIYDALVRLGQDFASRYPLVEGQGNFGSVDDPPAAMRYCVTGDALVATTEGTIPIVELAEVLPNSEIDIDIKVLDRNGDPVRAVRLFHTGLHPVLRMRTREGFELTGTHNHPVLCLVPVAGVPMLLWKLLEEVGPGDRVVIARFPQEQTKSLDLDLHFLAGAWVSQGFGGEGGAGFNTTDKGFFERLLGIYRQRVGGSHRVCSRALPSGDQLWELDVRDVTAFEASPLRVLLVQKSSAKNVPGFVWRGGSEEKRAFLQALFTGGGCSAQLARRSIRISYSTESARLAGDLQRLLLEFGIVSRQVHQGTGEIEVYVANRRDARLFAERVGFWGEKQEQLLARLRSVPRSSDAESVGYIPYVASYIRGEAGREGREGPARRDIDRQERWESSGHDGFAGTDDTPLPRVIEPLLQAGYYYATVESVEDAGVEPVYSIKVDSEDHSFLANGFVNHNTECRLEALAMDLLEGIDEDTVDFVDNYDGSEQEPAVLPSRFPNLLLNGGTGIAVGMATNIPPHNLGEVIDATIHMIDNPDATAEELMEFVKGPDFPSGGYIMGAAGIRDAFLTGRGSVKMRAVADVEELRKGRTAIIVREIPYQVSKDRIMEKIAQLVRDKKITGISDLRDESDRDGTRLVIELKQNAIPQVVLNQLHRNTQLQENFAVNMLALVDGVPRTLDLAEAIGHYLDHQMEVVERRTRHRLRKAKERAHIVEGLLVALDNIDEVVAIIRRSEDGGSARTALMERFELSETQANHILDMPLRRLTALETTKLRDEHQELLATIADLEDILADPARRRRIITDELGAIKQRYADPRRSRIIPDEGELSLEDLIADEDLVITISANGYVKSVLASAYRRQTRGGRGVKATELREDDAVTHVLHTNAHAYLLFFTNKGRVHRVKAHELPRKDRTAKGVLAQAVLPLEPEERIEAVVDTRDYETARYLVMVTRHGQVKKTKFSEYDSRSSSLIAISLQDGDEVVAVRTTNGRDDLLIFTRSGMGIRFDEEQIRPTGRSTQGVRGIRLRDGDEVVSAASDTEGDEVLLLTSRGYGKRTRMSEFPKQKRGGVGVRAMRLGPSRGSLVGVRTVAPGNEIFVVSSAGIVIRTSVDQISRQKRNASGVKVMNLPAGGEVSAFALVVENGLVAEIGES